MTLMNLSHIMISVLRMLHSSAKRWQSPWMRLFSQRLLKKR
nr:MAG TPA_asm: hypothetical protein [Bacteriophage sp.]